MTGTGPGQADLRWKGHDHGAQLFVYVHNEYLQVTAELGLVGLALLAILLAAIASLLWRARPPAPKALAGLGWSRRRQPSPFTAASTLSGICQPSCSP